VLPFAFIALGVGTGPLTVCIGAAAIGLVATWWMRHRWALFVAFGTGAVYTTVALAFWALDAIRSHNGANVEWSRYSLWWSLISLYATMTFIATLCTCAPVLPKVKQPK
jgi:hypothetical protein